MQAIRVDFYLLANSDKQACSLFACHLLEKAYWQDHRAFVYCNNQQEAEALDKLLWTYKDNSFIPHHLQGENPVPPSPIRIGFRDNPGDINDILFNLALEIPDFYSRFRRVIEIIPNDEIAKQLGRSHYREYRNKQCDLQIHEIK